MLREPMLETLNWIRKTPNVKGAIEDNSNCVLRNEYFYGRTQFNQTRSQILREMPELNLLSYNDLHMEFTQYGQIIDYNNDFGFSRNPTNSRKNDILKLREQLSKGAQVPSF